MKYLHYFLVAVMVTLVSKDSFSATEVVDGIAWTYTISDGQATIGEGNWVPAIDYNVVGKISVPSELGECPVVSIGSCAFSWCEKITSVTIPSSVVSIGPDAFYSCSKLVEVSIPASVTNIGEYAFGNCESLKSLAIPNGLVSIGNYAFRACTALKSVSLPISVNRIGYSAFVECDSISSISVPECVLQSTTPTVFPSSYSIITNVVICDGTKNIDRTAFYACSKLKTITVPEGVTNIGEFAFSGCGNLKSITIPESVTNIGERAFDGCSGLKRITIPSGVKSIEREAFRNCSGLAAIRILSDEISIASGAFSGCSSLGSGVVVSDGYVLCVNGNCPANVILPEGTRQIADAAFINCSGITTLSMPSTLKDISQEAFRGCTNLKSITIPPNVESVGRMSFYGCTSLKSVTISEGVKSIMSDAFCKCSSLTSLTIPASITNISGYAFYDCKSLGSGVVVVDGCVLGVNGTCPSSALLPPETRLLADGAFRNCSTLKSITIPSNTVRISDNCFSGCNNLTTVIMHDGITYIGQCAFLNCASLSDITIPFAVTDIGGWAFEGCATLKMMALPNDLRSIGVHLFRNCTNLTSVVIPSSVTNIGAGAFEYCKRLKEIAIPNGVLGIGDYAFSGCNELSSITIPSGVKNVSSDCCFGCRGLTAVTLLEGVETIGPSAFAGCSALVSLSIPSTVTNICNSFSGCSSLGSGVVIINDCVLTVNGECPTWVVLPEGTRIIAGSAFRGCETLSEIKIPKSVSCIAASAFYGTTLTNVFMLGSPAVPNAGSIYYHTPESLITYVTSDWKYTGQSWQDRQVKTLNVKMTPSGTTVLSGMTKLVMETKLQGGIIRYTLDGTDPTTASSAFVRALGISEATTVKAAVEYGGTMVSGCSETHFVLGIVESPMIDVYDSEGRKIESGEFYKEASVDISCEEPDARIYCSVNGGNYFEYKNEPFKINETTFIQAYAEKESFGGSQVVSKVLTRRWKQVATPIINTASHFDETNGQFVVTCSTDGATIRYAFKDGFSLVDDPTETSPIYVGPVKTFKGGTFKARAFGTDPEIWLPSDVASAHTTKWTGIPTTLDAPELVFETGGDAKWVTDFIKSEHHAGWDSMHSGALSASQKSWIQTCLHGPGELSFWWMTDCEGPANGAWDHLALYVDDLANPVMVRDGSNAWAKCCIQIGAGNHCVRWSYEKDGDAWGDGRDCGWIDHVVWIPDDGTGYTKAFPIPVAYNWLKKYGLLDRGAPNSIVASCIGKTHADGSSSYVWEDYVAGTDPTNPESKFTSSIKFENGEPVVTWSPDLNDEGKQSLRKYTTYGCENLGGNWQDMSTVPEADKSNYRFFKVTVELP